VRLLLYNPNSDQSLTEQMGSCVRDLLDAADELDLATGDEGPRFIGSLETVAAARAVAARRLAECAQDYDAILLGCFGDLGIAAVAAAVGKPVVSLWDACLAGVTRSGQHFGVVTTSAFWVERLCEDVQRHGLSEKIPSVLAIDVPPTASAADRRQATGDALRSLAKTSTVDVAVPGGALLTVLRADLLGVSPLPLFDSFAEAIDQLRTKGQRKR
jgi:Asp/Glu/hydantoin racemase